MPELDDRELLVVDERARRAAVDLRRACEERRRVRLRTGLAPIGWRLAVAMAAAVMLAGGLVAVALARSSPLARTASGAAFGTFGELPVGWRVTSVEGVDPLVVPDVGAAVVATIFATDAAPNGPIVRVTRYPGQSVMPGAAFGATDLTESTAEGRRVVLATDGGGGRLAWVERSDEWLVVSARAIDDDSLLAVLGAVEVDGAGRPTVAPDRLPVGLAAVSSGPADELSPALGRGAVTVVAESPDGISSVRLTTAPSADADLAEFGLLGDGITAVRVGGQPAWTLTRRSSDRVTRAILWRRDGTTYAMAVNDVKVDLTALSARVRWARPGDINGLRGADSGAQATTTAPGGSTPLPTTIRPATRVVIPADAPPVAVSITQADRSAYEAELSGQVVDGPAFNVDLAVVADVIRVQARQTGADGFSTLAVPKPGDTSFQLVGGDAGGLGTVVATTRPDGAFLEVLRSDGIRYRSPLTTLAARPDIRLGVLLVPADEFVSAALLAADGSVLASMPAKGSHTG